MPRDHFWLSYPAMSSARHEADEAARLLCGTVADAVEAAIAKLGVATVDRSAASDRRPSP